MVQNKMSKTSNDSIILWKKIFILFERIGNIGFKQIWYVWKIV